MIALFNDVRHYRVLLLDTIFFQKAYRKITHYNYELPNKLYMILKNGSPTVWKNDKNSLTLEKILREIVKLHNFHTVTFFTFIYKKTPNSSSYLIN